jgi:hypothetical protein
MALAPGRQSEACPVAYSPPIMFAVLACSSANRNIDSLPGSRAHTTSARASGSSLPGLGAAALLSSPSCRPQETMDNIVDVLVSGEMPPSACPQHRVRPAWSHDLAIAPGPIHHCDASLDREGASRLKRFVVAFSGRAALSRASDGRRARLGGRVRPSPAENPAQLNDWYWRLAFELKRRQRACGAARVSAQWATTS